MKSLTTEELVKIIPELVDTHIAKLYLLKCEREKIAEIILEKCVVTRKIDTQRVSEAMHKNTGMSVDDRMLEGMCDGCDQDPTKCLNQGYCEYEEVKQ